MPTNRRALLLAATGALAAPALLRAARAQPATPPAAAPQAPGFYRLKVGASRVTMLNDGSSRRPIAGYVVNQPLPDVHALFAGHALPTDTVEVPYTVTLVETPRRTVIFDTGNGGQLAPMANQLAPNMRAAGLDPARVDLVVISHYHGDHIAGLTSARDEPTFPNAQILVPEIEQAFWADDSNASRVPDFQRGTFPNVRKRFAPYAGRVHQYADGAEVAPGIRAMHAPGHTPGHMVFHLTDGADSLMILSDITNRPMPFATRPDYHAVFDIDADTAERSRRRLFDQVATDRLRVTGYHFPFPATGHMVKEPQGYRFEPSDWSTL